MSVSVSSVIVSLITELAKSGSFMLDAHMWRIFFHKRSFIVTILLWAFKTYLFTCCIVPCILCRIRIIYSALGLK